jgi:hypothetical protein
VFTTRLKDHPGVRTLLAFMAFIAILTLSNLGVNTKEAAADPQTDITAVLQMLQKTNPEEFLKGLTSSAGQEVAPTDVAPTPDALNVTTPQAVQVAGGTGWGQPVANIVQDGKTYVTSPYDASIIRGGPDKLGPKSFQDSVQQGADKMAANAEAHPQAVCEFTGPSQGNVVAQNAAAQVDRNVSCWDGVHVTGWGPPGNSGNGFVTAVPSQLVVTQTGVAKPIGPQDTADLYCMTGDLWCNTPDFRNLPAVAASLISLLEPGKDGTHYSQTNGYNTFREDLVYKTNSRGELDPKGNITQHVQVSENGFVILANNLNIPLDENQKQQIRQFAAQGTPGVKSMPVTPRELFDNPANIGAFMGVGEPQDSTPLLKNIPAVGNLGGDNLTGMVTQALGSVLPGLTGTNPTESTSVDPMNLVSNAVNGLTQNAIGEVPATENQAPSMAAPTQDYIDTGIAQVEEWANTQSPELGNIVNTVADVVDTFTGASQPTYTAPVSSMNDAPAQTTAPALDLGAVASQVGIPADLTNAVTGMFAGLPH